MAEIGCDRTHMLGTESIVSLRRQINDHSLLKNKFINKSHDKKWCLRPQHIIMDLTSSSNSQNAGYLVITETNRCISFYVKRSVFLAAVLFSFIFGLAFGTVIPLFLSPRRMCDSVVPKDVSYIKYIENHISSDNSSLFNNHLQNESNTLIHNLVDGVYWSDFVETLLPAGFGDEQDQKWKDFVLNSKVVRIEEGCGRMQNRLVTFQDGTKACCRYRQNTDQIQGEIFSYYLGRMLNLKNLVPSIVVMINSSDPLWLMARDHLQSSKWLEGRSVVLTEFVEDLIPALIPQTLQEYAGTILKTDNRESGLKNGELSPVSRPKDLGRITNVLEEIKNEKYSTEMAQWSDLIVFDYLTANLDRVVNNLYNLQWNPGMLSSPAHNLARVTSSELLVFLDNESGLLHGYRLLDKYEPYHSLLLDSLCLFRRPTVEALEALRLQAGLDLGTLLSRGLSSQDILPPLPEKSVGILSQRIDRVLRQVEFCGQRQSLAS